MASQQCGMQPTTGLASVLPCDPSNVAHMPDNTDQITDPFPIFVLSSVYKFQEPQCPLPYGLHLLWRDPEGFNGRAQGFPISAQDVCREWLNLSPRKGELTFLLLQGGTQNRLLPTGRKALLTLNWASQPLEEEDKRHLDTLKEDSTHFYNQKLSLF